MNYAVAVEVFCGIPGRLGSAIRPATGDCSGVAEYAGCGAGLNHWNAAWRYSFDQWELSSTIVSIMGKVVLQPLGETNLRSIMTKS